MGTILENGGDDKTKKELADLEATLATKVREFNKMAAEQKAKADAALEKKKLAEEARARKKQREEKARNSAITQNTAACNEVAAQIEEIQESLLVTEDKAEQKKLNEQLQKLLDEPTELASKVRQLNATAA